MGFGCNGVSWHLFLDEACRHTLERTGQFYADMLMRHRNAHPLA